MFKNIWKKRQTELASERANVPVNPVTDFGIEVDAQAQMNLLDCVLSELRGYLYEKRLVLKPDDELEWLLGIDQTEVTDLFETVISKLDCRRPEGVCVLPEIRTVGDLVREVRTFCLAKA